MFSFDGGSPVFVNINGQCSAGIDAVFLRAIFAIGSEILHIAFIFIGTHSQTAANCITQWA